MNKVIDFFDNNFYLAGHYSPLRFRITLSLFAFSTMSYVIWYVYSTNLNIWHNILMSYLIFLSFVFHFGIFNLKIYLNGIHLYEKYFKGKEDEIVKEILPEYQEYKEKPHYYALYTRFNSKLMIVMLSVLLTLSLLFFVSNIWVALGLIFYNAILIFMNYHNPLFWRWFYVQVTYGYNFSVVNEFIKYLKSSSPYFLEELKMSPKHIITNKSNPYPDLDIFDIININVRGGEYLEPYFESKESEE